MARVRRNDESFLINLIISNQIHITMCRCRRDTFLRKNILATIRELGEVADVWIKFGFSFKKINRGDTETDSAFLKRKRLIFR